MRLLQLFLVFFTIGLFSIGGGYAIIPLIQAQVVDKYGWIAQGTLTDIITISQMTPGPLAVNTATFVGLQIAGVAGAVLATLGCIIGGILVALGLHRLFGRHRESPLAVGILSGLRASSLGLICSAAAIILLLTFTGSGKPGDSKSLDFQSLAVFAAALVALRGWRANPMLVIAAAGAIGALIY